MPASQVFLPLDGGSECAGYDVVYVSPHLDDVAFSCAAHIFRSKAEGLRPLVVTVFSRGDPQRAANAYSQYGCRLEEDASCMRALGADWLYADFEELVFRSSAADTASCLTARLAWAYAAGWCCSPGLLTERLATCLKAIALRTKAAQLLAPAGMGYHPDHLLVHHACCELRHQLRGQLRVAFYHDWAYSRFALLREPRLWARSLRGLRTVELRAEGEALEAGILDVLAQKDKD